MFFSKKPKIQTVKKNLAKDPNAVFKISEAFPDQAFAAVIAEALGKRVNDKTTLNELSLIETLNASQMGLTSLEGLEFLNHLKTANFSSNNITRLPDYTQSSPYTARNKDSLILMDLSDNPFLNPDNLFSLDSSEMRRKFIGQFSDAASRFNLGDVEDRIFTDNEVNPAIIRLAVSSLLPRESGDSRDQQINDIFLKYVIGKKLFYNKDVYKNGYILTDGKLRFSTELISPPYLNNESKAVISQLLEQMLPNEDLYLIRSLIQNNKPLKKKLNSIEDYVAAFSETPEELSPDYVKTPAGFREKLNYTDLKDASLSSEEELLLKSISNPVIKDEYNRYIQIKDIIELYKDEHPERFAEVEKLLTKNDRQIVEFLKKYSDLERNSLLTDKQKQTIKQAEKAIKTFNQNYITQAGNLFEQDVFGLEVEMKYIDMLAEAERKIR